jgi:hypothetical protein
MNRTSAFLKVAVMTVVFGTVVPIVSSNSIEVGGSRTQRFAMIGQSGDETGAKVLSGTIWKNGDRFVLRDERQKHWYQLDVDQELAAKFEGRHVKVIGTLDPGNSEIRVQRIEEG